MKTINGISIDNYTYSVIQQGISQGNKVYIALPDEGTGSCPNCNGGGNVIVTMTPQSAMKSPVGVVSYINDECYRATNTAYPCPICMSTPNLQDLIDDSGLTFEELYWSIDYIDGMPGKENALSVARSILEQSPTPAGLYTFFGDYGVGKTGLIKSMTAALVNSYIKSKYLRGSDFLVEVKGSFSDKDTSEASITNKYSRYQFLAIDEVDRVSDTEWSRSLMFSLLDRRYEARNRVCTVLVTNRFPDKMGEHWGYLMSRMLDGIRVPVGGSSLRGVK